jgi:hypothetical protein
MGADAAFEDLVQIEQDLAASLERSRQRRRSRRRNRRVGRLRLLAVLALIGAVSVADRFGAPDRLETPAPPAGLKQTGTAPVSLAAPGAPPPDVAAGPPLAVDRAWRFASAAPGLVSVAVIRPGGEVQALRGGRRFVSASMVKAVMLAAYLRELAKDGAALDYGAAMTLEEMITYSDNDAADEIYFSLGDEPIEAAARAAGARTLDVRGYWSETYLSARDAARFIWAVERIIPVRFRDFAMRQLAGVVSYQRWGIPEAAGTRWRVWFKGGWRTTGLGALTHQTALLRRGDRRLAIAVLTDGMPSMAAGTETIEGVARRLIPPVSPAESRP